MTDSERHREVVVIGGGQAGLATGFYLRRTDLSWLILDDQAGPGGAWRRTWDSLRLFSPARFSSLPGWLMPGGADTYPTRDEAADYLARYETRYGFPVERPVHARAVTREEGIFRIATDGATWTADAVVSATGSWAHPVVPDVPGRETFLGVQIHSAEYRGPDAFAGRRVLVVGGGNSGAQVLAEVSRVADATWITLDEPRFLPDHVDGRYLFDQATEIYRAQKEGRPPPPPANLGDVVMVPPVREARDRGVLRAVRPFARMTERGVVWPDGRAEDVDAVIWCTGYRAALEHLRSLGLVDADGRVAVRGTRAVREPMLWLVGYGNWTGFASATLVAVGRSARATVDEIASALRPADVA
ncbi:ArsO family NAD(P)H-dependent flavin-containing monooxygenase [Longimicrobium sp.]|uniref:ArsO family NAD(P)H-dependent flavin-containing monooxygenase n=1 Tax=Longimicrobium sp. TaxID=2029185 RepID=UPI002E31A706|nr:ArsO family NAD(P)H-dependent flavin-containing monooxygenase [Longimicrobium sp.]HEX6038640.1 ArsO family NAD(P)H-dependent flavin-containing monooxygenase [Longimicrobium sp.]